MSRSCNYYSCTNPVFGGGMCRNHQGYRTDRKAPQWPKRADYSPSNAAKDSYPQKRTFKPKAAIKKASKKRAEINKEYLKIVKEMLAENPNCEVKESGCQVKATGLHHKQKRSPSNLTLRSNLMRACNNCQLWIELNHKLSIERGYSISRFAKT